MIIIGPYRYKTDIGINNVTIPNRYKTEIRINRYKTEIGNENRNRNQYLTVPLQNRNQDQYSRTVTKQISELVRTVSLQNKYRNLYSTVPLQNRNQNQYSTVHDKT